MIIIFYLCLNMLYKVSLNEKTISYSFDAGQSMP